MLQHGQRGCQWLQLNSKPKTRSSEATQYCLVGTGTWTFVMCHADPFLSPRPVQLFRLDLSTISYTAIVTVMKFHANVCIDTHATWINKAALLGQIVDCNWLIATLNRKGINYARCAMDPQGYPHVLEIHMHDTRYICWILWYTCNIPYMFLTLALPSDS